MIPLLFLQLLIPTLAVVNTTASLQLPLSVQVSAPGQTAAGSTAPAFDAATVTTVAGLATAIAYRWKKSDKHENTFKDRTVTGAQTAMQTAESLRQTDYGIQEMLASISKSISLIPGVPVEAVKIIDSQLQDWQKDNESYYIRTPAKATDLSTDPIVKKLGEIQKISEKND